MNDIGKKIFERREALGLTLEEVGNAVGVSRSTVQRWENGLIKNMKGDKISALAKILQMRPVELVPGSKKTELTELKRITVRKPLKRIYAIDALPKKYDKKFMEEVGIPDFSQANITIDKTNIEIDKDLESLMKVWKVSTPDTRKKIVRVIKSMCEEE